MRLLRLSTIYIFVVGWLLCMSSCALAPQEAGADVILLNGKVYTFAWDEPATDGTPAKNAPYAQSSWKPDAEAIAVTGDKIVFVGSAQEAERYRHAHTRVGAGWIGESRLAGRVRDEPVQWQRQLAFDQRPARTAVVPRRERERGALHRSWHLCVLCAQRVFDKREPLTVMVRGRLRRARDAVYVHATLQPRISRKRPGVAQRE